jgi:hypothetical protein
MNFSRFSAFSAITGPAERKNSLQMRRFQTICEFSHGLVRVRPAAPDSILLTDPVGTMPSSARKCGGRRIDMLVTKNGGRLTPAIEEIINGR